MRAVELADYETVLTFHYLQRVRLLNEALEFLAALDRIDNG
jgi:hypothetical protein